MLDIKFTDDWIRTAELWSLKRPLYQLSHNHCPVKQLYVSEICTEKKIEMKLKRGRGWPKFKNAQVNISPFDAKCC